MRAAFLLFVSLAAMSSSSLAVDRPLPPGIWADQIRAGWVGKVSAGSGALPTETWPKERVRERYGELSTPPQKPTPRGPLDDTTLALLGWHAARERGPDFAAADIAREWVDHLTDADLRGGGFGRGFLDVLRRLRKGEQPPHPHGHAAR